jgi:lipopolysaccharide transport system permease protein
MPPTANEQTAGSVESVTEQTSRKARAAAASLGPSHITVIEARRGWRLVDWRELVAYRDLFRFLIWREIKVRYAQSVIGIGWAVIQPVFSMLIFTIVFGRLAAVPSDGVPYPLFSLAAMVPWTFFSNALIEGANSHG